MCYDFINYVIKSVGERFDSLCWCRLKSGGDLIFASNLPGDRVYGKVGGVFCRIVAYVFVCLCCFYCCVFYYFAVVVVVLVKIPPLLVERVGGECCDRFFGCSYFDVAVEAFASVFYVFLPHGDAVRCLMRRDYLGEEFDGVVGSGVGVVKRRQV